MMRLRLEPPPVYFMHLPKTGGTGLGQWLCASYGARSYVALVVPLLSRYRVADLQRYRCYHPRHFGRSMYELIGRSDVLVITLLRSPVERATSWFEHRRRLVLAHPERFAEDYLEQVRPFLHLPLAACLQNEAIVNDLDNFQTRLLGERQDYTPLLKHGSQAFPPDARVRIYRAACKVAPGDYVPLLANAKTWLDEMAVVGLTERFHESVLLIADRLGIPAPEDMPYANVNPQRSDPAMRYRDQLAPEVIARLEELNRYDLELYTHATELFEQQWARYQARPRRTYSVAPRLRISLRQARPAIKRWFSHL